jgi:hypothetical protein
VSECRICFVEYVKAKPMQAVCGLACAQVMGQRKAELERVKKERAERVKDNIARITMKTQRDWINEVQIAFNKFIRTRDAHKTCICCGQPLSAGDVGGRYDAGHYRSVGSAPHLRFHEDNCHAQTKRCNRYGAGRAVDYRLGLIQRIGLEAVERLEADQDRRKYSIDELKALKAEFSRKARELEKRRDE